MKVKFPNLQRIGIDILYCSIFSTRKVIIFLTPYLQYQTVSIFKNKHVCTAIAQTIEKILTTYLA